MEHKEPDQTRRHTVSSPLTWRLDRAAGIFLELRGNHLARRLAVLGYSGEERLSLDGWSSLTASECPRSRVRSCFCPSHPASGFRSAFRLGSTLAPALDWRPGWDSFNNSNFALASVPDHLPNRCGPSKSVTSSTSRTTLTSSGSMDVDADHDDRFIQTRWTTSLRAEIISPVLRFPVNLLGSGPLDCCDPPAHAANLNCWSSGPDRYWVRAADPSGPGRVRRNLSRAHPRVRMP